MQMLHGYNCMTLSSRAIYQFSAKEDQNSHKKQPLRRSVVVSGVGLINEVIRHWVRLVLGSVTVCGRANHLGM